MSVIEAFRLCHEWFYEDHDFNWQSDLERVKSMDKWLILKPVDGVFTGDCEDAALTIINKCLSIGFSEEHLYVCRVATPNCPKQHQYDHAVALFIDAEGKWWISDNRCSNAILNLFDLGDYKFYDAVSIDNLRGNGVPKLIGK